jgi:eukaryotic-like serine/threonine-protein kinase
VQRAPIAERYRLLRTVGSGGMGQVWLARDEMLHREVAVKEVLPPDWMTPAERDDLRLRTLREARTAARIDHPNVVRIFDVVYAEGSPWIVMEYVPSRSLHQVVEADGPLPPERVAEIGLKVLDALDAAHRAGVLHRDVKPHNVLIADDGRVVLTDFGLATFDGDSSVTRQGLVMGSPQYVAPERARDGVSTAESDLWSLGATLYAAVEGRSPFARPTTLGTLTALATSPPDPPQRAGPLRPVLAGLLRKDPRQRFTVDEVDRLLRRIVDPNVKPRPRLLPRPRRAVENVPVSEGLTVNLGGGAPPGRVRSLLGAGRRRATVLAAVAVLLAASLGTALALTRDGGTPSGAGPGVSTTSGGTPGSSGAAAGEASPFPCGSYSTAGTTRVTAGPGPPPGVDRNPQPGFTWYTNAAERWWIGAPLDWRTFTDSGTTCFVNPETGRTVSVTPQRSTPANPVRYWEQQADALRADGLLPGYRNSMIQPTLLHDGGAFWDFVYVPEGRALRVVSNLVTIGGRTYVYRYSCPDADFDADMVTRLTSTFVSK